MPDPGATTELLRLLGEPTRVRLLALLGREAPAVAEITDVTQLAQSRASTHLGQLREAGVVKDRRDGNERPRAAQPEPQNGCFDAGAPTVKKPRRRAEP
ncbi:ArsR/SmtB family transcription factor [Sorangium sp. So ce118]